MKGKISTKIAITTNFLLVVLTCSTLFISVFDSIGGLRSLIPL